MHRWFHPKLSNVDAEKLLLEQGEDGSFLVRPSRSCLGAFSLSVRRKNQVTHIKIRKTGDFYDLNGGEQFATLTELVQYYVENQVKEKNGEIFLLRQPIKSTGPITARYFHGSLNGKDAERILIEKGVYGSFLVRESQRHVGDYVLTVRTKDEVSQADKISHVVIRHQDNKYDVGGGEQFNTLPELVDYYMRNPMVEEGAGTVVIMKHPFNATRITALDIDARVKELLKENPHSNGKEGFLEEFEQLQHQECKILFNRKIGQDERNISKNRYKNILPYDYTRVILNRPKSFRNDDKNYENDYINANFIKLVEDETNVCPRTKPVPYSKTYIATQGPLPNTVNDFWWMIWQEGSECIVMVTKEVERGKIKCCRYWPTMDQQILCYGPIQVRIILDTGEQSQNSTNNDYIHREFEIKNLGSDDDRSPARRIVHYQYLSWPDQNIPSSPTSVIQFLDLIGRRPLKGPLVAHCSAGIGRSGTLIVIDMLMDQLKHHGLSYEIDIQRIVKIARAQRSGLVQTEAQYKFIYLAIQSYIANSTRICSSRSTGEGRMAATLTV